MFSTNKNMPSTDIDGNGEPTNSHCNHSRYTDTPFPTLFAERHVDTLSQLEKKKKRYLAKCVLLPNDIKDKFLFLPVEHR